MPLGQCCRAPASTRLRRWVCGVSPAGDELTRILVFQILHRKRAARGDHLRLGQQLEADRVVQARDLAEMTFAIRKQTPASFRYRHREANRGDQVLKLTSLALVHVDVTTGDEWQAQLTAKALQLRQAGAIVTIA